ncbi:hypothetical protein RMSM_05855 [Rhodopirellula maiorica SM1]|uniref:Uncharacterized protein n=1 Tax=Rhodopirellula maiorica SM1 TaxID=1265738 RepID=M5RPA0_9BACT|nr:hypothetical protein RMSM_05855 [Rhodopirellula maiorica SM1]
MSRRQHSAKQIDCEKFRKTADNPTHLSVSAKPVNVPILRSDPSQFK